MQAQKYGCGPKWTYDESEGNAYWQPVSDSISDYMISHAFNPPSSSATSNNTDTTPICFTVDQSKFPVSLLLEKDHTLVTKHLLHTQSPS